MKSRALGVCLLAVLALLSTGCSWKYAKDFDVPPGSGVVTDAKRRAIVGNDVDPDGVAGASPARRVICAEPSPDALSSIAYQLAAKGSVPEKAALDLGLSLQEGAASIGLRTQSIQLLRDQAYRICEAYMNGAITEPHYELLMRRYQRQLVAVLAIEQITGVVRAAPAEISTQGVAEVSKSWESVRDQIKDIEGQIAEQKKIVDSEGDSSENEAKKASARTKIAELETDKAALEEGLKSSRSLIAKGAANVSIVREVVEKPRSDQHVETVSNVVLKLAAQVLSVDDSPALCAIALSRGNASSTFVDWCQEMQKADLELQREIAKHVDILAQAYAKNPNDEKVRSAYLEGLPLLKESGPNVKSVRERDLETIESPESAEETEERER